MKYNMLNIISIKDVSKVIDFLKVKSLHNVTSYFWWGDVSRTFTSGGRGGGG